MKPSRVIPTKNATRVPYCSPESSRAYTAGSTSSCVPASARSATQKSAPPAPPTAAPTATTSMPGAAA